MHWKGRPKKGEGTWFISGAFYTCHRACPRGFHLKCSSVRCTSDVNGPISADPVCLHSISSDDMSRTAKRAVGQSLGSESGRKMPTLTCLIPSPLQLPETVILRPFGGDRNLDLGLPRVASHVSHHLFPHNHSYYIVVTLDPLSFEPLNLGARDFPLRLPPRVPSHPPLAFCPNPV